MVINQNAEPQGWRWFFSNWRIPICVFCGLLWIIAVVFFPVVSATNFVLLYLGRTYDIWFPIYAAILLFGLLNLICCSTLAYSYIKFADRKEESFRQNDMKTGNCVIYLRPFSIERRLTTFYPQDLHYFSGIVFAGLPLFRYRNSLQRTIERAAAVRDLSVITIGGHDNLPGVTKLQIHDSHWQGAFTELVEKCKGALIVPFTTDGTMWEFRWLLENCWDRTLLIMPPENAKAGFGSRNLSYRKRWGALRAEFHNIVELPHYEPSGYIFYFWKDGARLHCEGAGTVWDAGSALINHLLHEP